MKLKLIIPVMTLAIAAWAPHARAQAEQTPENLLDEPLDPQAESETAADAEPDADPGGEEEAEEAAASRETDFNEENFRRSMELRDRALQRSPDLTTGSYSSGTGVRALDALPEASQKHLREALREVIVQNGPWTPEAAGEVYPYTPSEGARENRDLEKRERAAWGELVAEYHEREAAIHSNAARSQAATTGSPAGTETPSGAEVGEGSPPGQQRSNARDRAAGQSAAEAQRAAAPQGVSQNALELLTNRQQLPPAGATGQGQPQQAQAAQASMQQSAQEQQQSSQQQASQQQVDLESDDVIAIDDLSNIDLDTANENEEEREERR